MKKVRKVENDLSQTNTGLKQKDPLRAIEECDINLIVNDQLISILLRFSISIDQLVILKVLKLGKEALLNSVSLLSDNCYSDWGNVESLISRKFIIRSSVGFYALTTTGFELLKMTDIFFPLKSAMIPSHSAVTSSQEQLFDEWWQSYPRTANWIADNGQMFNSGRVLRTGTKKQNQKLYLAILQEGNYSHEQLMACLKFEIDAKKKQSMLRAENALNYMKGSHSYLECRYFENFIALIETGVFNEGQTSSWEAG